MNLDPNFPTLPKGVASILHNITDQAVGFRASASNNVAKDYAVQVCGPVAGTIQYMFVYALLSLLPPSKFVSSGFR